MPKQSRGFWHCDYCRATFDDFQEASYHESYECQSAAAAAAAANVHHPLHLPPPPIMGGMPPQPEAYMGQPPPPGMIGDPQQQQPPNLARMAMPPQQQQQLPPLHHHHHHHPAMYGHDPRQMPPLSLGPRPPPLPPHPPPSPQQTSSSAGGGAALLPPQQHRFRRYLFLEPDTHQQQHHLTEADDAACRNLEIFEASHAHSAPFSSTTTRTSAASSTGSTATTRMMPIEPGQVGIRCIHCQAVPQGETAVGPGRSTEYPLQLNQVADCVREIAETHFVACPRMSVAIRQLMEVALEQRAIAKDQGGRAWYDEENKRRHLQQFCAYRLQELGVVLRFPPDGGLMFRSTLEMQQQQEMMLGGSSAGDTSRGFYGPSSGMPLHQRGASGSTGASAAAAASSGAGSPLSGSAGSRSNPASLKAPPSPSFEGGRSFNSTGTTPPRRQGGDEDPAATEPLPVGGPSRREMQQPSQQRPDHQQEGSRSASSVDGGGGGSSSGAEPQQAAGGTPPSAPLYEDNTPANFPFLREPSGNWVCKFCQHVQAHYRDPQYRWAATNNSPPPAHFIDHHLNQCRMYQQSLLQDIPPQLPGGPGGPSGFPFAPMIGPPPPHQQQQQQSPSGGMPGWDPGMGDPLVAGGSGGADFFQFGMAPQQSGGFPGGPPGESQGGATGGDTLADQAMAYLEANDLSYFNTDGTAVPDESRLVLEEDRLLLTNYFFYLMKQLRLVRFSEADRKTRGGKREKIQVGYGGLQCVHCAQQPNARKFFWSNVDRLANSFAEIPAHVLKCRSCPERTKSALLTLKEQHPEQMTRLPRGSQKVFFRRMWRRLHHLDPAAPEAAAAASPRRPKQAKKSERAIKVEIPPPPLSSGEPSPPVTAATAAASAARAEPAGGSPGTQQSDESILLLERPTAEAAKALADSAMQPGPPTPTSRVLLAIPEDGQWLSDTDCFVRRQVEVFCATKEDIQVATTDRKYPVTEGQVGIRCIHCALAKAGGASGQAVAYPFSISGIYESVREFHRLHLDECPNLPPAVKSRLSTIKGSSSLSSVLRKYYVLSAKALGLIDTKDGIRASGKGAPLDSQAAFSFAEAPSPHRGSGTRSSEHQHGHASNTAAPPPASERGRISPSVGASGSGATRLTPRKRSASGVGEEEEGDPSRNQKPAAK